MEQYTCFLVVLEHCARYAKAEDVGKRPEESSDEDDDEDEDEYDSNDDEIGGSSDV